MRKTRGIKFASMAFAGAIALSACASSDSGGSDTASDIDCAKGTLSAEGSTFQKNGMAEWIKIYQQKCPGASINYNPTGSGAGVRQFLAGQVDFGGSDTALSEEEAVKAEARCGGNPAWNLPMLSGATTVSYNVPGVDSLVLSSDVVAKIFIGQITTWDDPAIKDLNPGATLPSSKITVFFRSDDSGTTDNFTKWLAAAAPSVWTAKPSKTWPDGAAGEGKPGNAGLLEAVTANQNSITYLDYSDAKAGRVTFAKVDFGAGPVELTPETAGKALAEAQDVGSGNDLKLELDYAIAESDAYPIVAISYQLVCSAGLPADKAALQKSFFAYTSSEDGQAQLDRIGYIALPEELRSKVADAVEALQ